MKDKRKIVNNNISKEELLDNIVITNTTTDDIPHIIMILADSFNMRGYGEAFYQILDSDMDLHNSVKAIDKRDGKIYGLLMFSNYPINVGTPLEHINKDLSRYLYQYNGIDGHSFILDERLRGTGIDNEMLHYNDDLFEKEWYDFIWCGVGKDYHTEHYWKRKGFIKICEIPEASFWIYPLNEDIEFDITRFYKLPK